MSFADTWGTTPEEREVPFNCDRFWDDEGLEGVFFRGVTVNASPTLIYKWLCQLRVAPYSYDWIDNFCRRSPRTLTPGLDDLTLGTHIFGMCEVVDFEPGKSITIRGVPNGMEYLRLRGIVVTYMIIPQSEERCRLLVKGMCRFSDDLLGRLMRWCILWGDLIMMRKQLLNFKAFSEKTTAEEV
jgi:hypothetical protein